MKRASTLMLVAILGGCASATSIPDADRHLLSLELSGKPRFLRVSCYKGPFWQDDTKLLLTDVPPEELSLLADTQGKPIHSGPPTGIVPAGRVVKILKVEFPTALVMAGRMVYTPRYNPWIYLQAEGEDPARPLILVLRSGIASREQFLGEVERYLSLEDPASILGALSDGMRAAVAEKKLMVGMDAQTAQMAWGYPTNRHIELAGGTRTERWTYANGRRTIQLTDGKVVKFEAPAAP